MHFDRRLEEVQALGFPTMDDYEEHMRCMARRPNDLQPDVKPFVLQRRNTGDITCVPVGFAPVPDGGRLVAARIVAKPILLSSDYCGRTYLPNRIEAIRVSVVKKPNGARYAQGEYMVVESGSGDVWHVLFLPVGDKIEDYELRAMNEAAREIWDRHCGRQKNLFDLGVAA